MKSFSVLLLLAASVMANDDIVPPLPQHFEYVLQGTICNGTPITVATGEHFRCSGPDKEHLICGGIDITVHGRLDDCLQINVIHDGPARVKETK